MKTAISIPDELFAAADAHARASGQSRSQLYARAVREYLARHAPDSVTETLDAVYGASPAPERAFTGAASRRVLESVDW